MSAADNQEIKLTQDKIDSFLEAEGGISKTGESVSRILEADIKGLLKDEKRREYPNILNFLFEYYGEIIIGIGLFIIAYLDYRFIMELYQSIRFLDLETFPQTGWSFTLFIIFAMSIWISSTAYDYWNYYNRKFASLYFIIISLIMRLAAAVYYIFYLLFIPFIARWEPNELLTESKIITLGYILTIAPTIIITVTLTFNIIKGLIRDDNIKKIKQFKIKHYMDFKPVSKYDYDFVSVRDLHTGQKIRIRQHDRYMHGAADGATGTAKTSSVLLPMIVQDLLTKIINEDTQKKNIVKLIKKGKAYLTKSFNNKDYSPGLLNKIIKPVPGHEKEFEKKVLKYQSAGMTVIAPDPSLPDDVYAQTKVKKVKCNRIDPVHNIDGSLKEGSIGINPLYVSPLIPDWEKRKEMVKKATLCADIMQIMNEMVGKGDPYFTSINRIATTTAAMAVMLAHEKLHPGQKPKITYIRDIINNFDTLKAYVPIIQEINKENGGVYKPILDVILNEFLGIGREKFEQHCSGLRVQLNNFLMHPDIERILCADETVDLDRMLEEGEVTVINIEYGDLGPVNSPCFGLFITISLINAVLRRKGNEWDRLPHFWTIDELPIVINPSMEVCFTLFRKFRTSMMVAFQTLDQMNKNPYLRYLKGVILNSCAQHIVFGRTNIDDQETYSALGGSIDQVTLQENYSQTPLSVENPSYHTSNRYSVATTQRVKPEEIRERDFQEVTFFSTQQGRAIAPKAGKVNFLKKSDWKEIKRYSVDWEKLYKEQPYKTSDMINDAAANSAASTEQKTVLTPQDILLGRKPNSIIEASISSNKVNISSLPSEAAVSSIAISDASEGNIPRKHSNPPSDVKNISTSVENETNRALRKTEIKDILSSETAATQDASDITKAAESQQAEEEEKVLFNVFMDTKDL
ncbi:MAG: TraM recognition domain-containing protein [Clostridia bacterium]